MIEEIPVYKNMRNILKSIKQKKDFIIDPSMKILSLDGSKYCAHSIHLSNAIKNNTSLTYLYINTENFQKKFDDKWIENQKYGDKLVENLSDALKFHKSINYLIIKGITWEDWNNGYQYLSEIIKYNTVITSLHLHGKTPNFEIYANGFLTFSDALQSNSTITKLIIKDGESQLIQVISKGLTFNSSITNLTLQMMDTAPVDSISSIILLNTTISTLVLSSSYCNSESSTILESLMNNSSITNLVPSGFSIDKTKLDMITTRNKWIQWPKYHSTLEYQIKKTIETLALVLHNLILKDIINLIIKKLLIIKGTILLPSTPKSYKRKRETYWCIPLDY